MSESEEVIIFTGKRELLKKSIYNVMAIRQRHIKCDRLEM